MKERQVIDLLVEIFSWTFLVSLVITVLWGIYSILAVFDFHFIAIVVVVGIIAALGLGIVLPWQERIYHKERENK